MKQGISVIICSYNGANFIGETLQHLAAQKTAFDLYWEVILINNASTDNTVEIAENVWKQTGCATPLRILNEPTPGKNNAVDKGIEEAKCLFVLICDDDNWLEENYIQTAYEIMIANKQIGMLGGQGIPVFESSPPKWFEQYQNYYAVGQQNLSSGEVTTQKGFLWGAGALINKFAYYKLRSAGFQRIITYNNYPKSARGEDTELCMAIILTGFKIWYDDRLIFQHFISSNRLTWTYLKKVAKEGSLMSPIIGLYKSVQGKKMNNCKTDSYLWIKIVLRRLLSINDIKNMLCIIFTKEKEGDAVYFKRMSLLYNLMGYFIIGNKYINYSNEIIQLRNRLEKTFPDPK